MDAETLKIILELKEENVLYKRAIGDLFLMINGKKKFQTIEYPMKDVCLSFLFDYVERLFQEKSEQPQNQSGDSDNCAN